MSSSGTLDINGLRHLNTVGKRKTRGRPVNRCGLNGSMGRTSTKPNQASDTRPHYHQHPYPPSNPDGCRSRRPTKPHHLGEEPSAQVFAAAVGKPENEVRDSVLTHVRARTVAAKGAHLHVLVDRLFERSLVVFPPDVARLLRKFDPPPQKKTTKKKRKACAGERSVEKRKITRLEKKKSVELTSLTTVRVRRGAVRNSSEFS